MKRLNTFLKFDCADFLNGKVLQATGTRPTRDYETKQITGTTVETVIIKDDTDYHLKTDEQVSNLYERINIKVKKMNYQVPVGAIIELVNPVGTVYGDYRNQLSIRCDDVRVIQVPAQRKP